MCAAPRRPVLVRRGQPSLGAPRNPVTNARCPRKRGTAGARVTIFSRHRRDPRGPASSQLPHSTHATRGEVFSVIRTPKITRPKRENDGDQEKQLAGLQHTCVCLTCVRQLCCGNEALTSVPTLDAGVPTRWGSSPRCPACRFAACEGVTPKEQLWPSTLRRAASLDHAACVRCSSSR